MSKLAGTVLDTILERIRGDGGVAHTDVLGLDVLSKCQRITNIFTRSVVAEASFNTAIGQTIYDLPTLLPSAVDVLEIRVASTGKRLAMIPALTHLAATHGFDWMGSSSPLGYFSFVGNSTDREYDADATSVDELANNLTTLIADLGLQGATKGMESFLQLGRTHLFIFPAPLAVTSLTARYVALTSELTADATPLEVPDEDAALVAKLAEISLLLRQRAIGEAVYLLKELSGGKNDKS